MKKRHIIEWITFSLFEMCVVFVAVYVFMRDGKIAGITALAVGACVAVILVIWAWRNKRRREREISKRITKLMWNSFRALKKDRQH